MRLLGGSGPWQRRLGICLGGLSPDYTSKTFISITETTIYRMISINSTVKISTLTGINHLIKPRRYKSGTQTGPVNRSASAPVFLAPYKFPI